MQFSITNIYFHLVVKFVCEYEMVSHTKTVRLHRMVGPKVYTSYITCNTKSNLKNADKFQKLRTLDFVWFPRKCLKIWTLEYPPFQKKILILKSQIPRKHFPFCLAFVHFLGNQTEGK